MIRRTSSRCSCNSAEGFTVLPLAGPTPIFAWLSSAREGQRAVDVTACPGIEKSNPRAAVRFLDREICEGAIPETLDDGVSIPRNPVLLNLLQSVPSNAGYQAAEGQGSGIRLMINRMADGSLQPPEFNASPARLVVTLRRHGTEVPELRSWLNGLADRDLSPEEDAVLVTINRDGESSIPRMHELLGYDSADLQKITSALRREGILRESAKGAFSIANGSPLPSGASLSVLDTLEPGDELSIRELSDHTGRSVGVLRRVLRELIEGGWVEATAPPTSRQRKYRRPR